MRRIESKCIMFGFRNKKWRKFKTFADSIGLAKERGYAVSWNKKISGVFFDAIVEVNKPPRLFLFTVKCVESQTPVSLNEAGRFVKDAEQIGATVAILISESGFEENCAELYANTCIKLLTLETVNNTSPERQYVTKSFPGVEQYMPSSISGWTA